MHQFAYMQLFVKNFAQGNSKIIIYDIKSTACYRLFKLIFDIICPF